MSSLQQIKCITRLNQQRIANASRTLARIGVNIEGLCGQIREAEVEIQTCRQAIALMRGETGQLLNRGAFFERKRREAVLLAQCAEQRHASEYLRTQLVDLYEQERLQQQGIVVLQGKSGKWQKVEGLFRRESQALQRQIEDRSIEGNVLCKQLIALR
jgi:hypothetical protein